MLFIYKIYTEGNNIFYVYIERERERKFIWLYV